jgi:hypothetical protein
MLGQYRSRQTVRALQWDSTSIDEIAALGDARKVLGDGTLVLYRGHMPYEVRVGDWIAFDFGTPIHYVKFLIYDDAEFRRLYSPM